MSNPRPQPNSQPKVGPKKVGNIVVVPATSPDEVMDAVERWKPGAIAIQMCEKRAEMLFYPDEVGERRISEYFVQKGAFFSLISQLFYASLEGAREGHVEKIREITSALERYTSKRGVVFEYVDMPLDIMVKRAWRRGSFGEKIRVARLFRKEIISFKEPTGDTKTREKHVNLEDAIMSAAPSTKEVIVGERALYIAHRIKLLEQRVRDRYGDGCVLAVVEPDWLNEIADELGKVEKPDPKVVKELETLPPRIKWERARWALPVVLITLFALSIIKGEKSAAEIFWWWALATSLGAGIGAVVSRAHPLSILSAVVTAPFISFTFIGAGWVAGLVELKVRKPTVGDLQQLGGMENLRDLFRNPAIKPIVVGSITNAGNWLGVALVLPYLVGGAF